VFPTAPKVPKKVRIMGRPAPGSASIKGSDIRVFDAETGDEFAECQALSFGISVDDGHIEAKILYIDLSATPPPGEVVVEHETVVEVVSIDIQPLKKVN
jgi:hypothetical protein